MLSLDFDDLLLKRQTRHSSDKIPKLSIKGYDTETIKGYCTLLCDSKRNYIHPQSFYEILSFLTRKSNRSTTGFFYNLKYDFQSILKYLDPEQWVTVYHTGELILEYGTQGYDYEKFTLKYIPKKMLVIKRLVGIDKKTGKEKFKSFKFYDIAQYYKMKLDDAAEQYLGERKLQHDFDLANLTDQDMKNPVMIEYCIKDAVLCERLAKHWIDICFSQGLYTSNFSSPAAIAGRYFASKCYMPDINAFRENDEGKNLLRYAWNTCAGAFISCFKRGYFPECHEYDICSAYPAEMAKLPDLRSGYFILEENEIPKDAVLGWIRCRVEIDYDIKEAYHPAFPVLRKGASNYYPIGGFEQYMTLAEYREYSKVFGIKVIDGVYWVPDSELIYPFRETIEDLYTRRIATTDANVNFFIKIVLNGIYGKFLEKHKILNPEDENHGKFTTGNFFNPFISSYILAGARLQVFKMLASVPNDDILACFTDSVLLKNKLPIGKVKELGKWGYEQSGQAVIIGCGIYSIQTPEKLKTRVRGFKTVGKLNLFKELEKDEERITVPIKTNLAPLSAFIQKRPDEMNLLLDGEKTINVNFDTKRIWQGSFNSPKQLLEKSVDSFPYFHGI